MQTVKTGMEHLFSQWSQVVTAKRIVDDTKKRFQTIYDLLEQGQLAEAAGLKLIEMAEKCVANDLAGAKALQQQLSSTSYDQKNKYWLVGVHRAITELEKHQPR